MKRILLLLFILLATLFYALGPFFKEETIPLSRAFFAAESSTSAEPILNLKEMGWGPSKTGASKGGSLGKRELDQVYQWKLDRGVRNLTTFSLYLTRLAGQERRQGNLSKAVELATYASKLSPDLPQPYFELARARFKHRPFAIHEALLEAWRGLRAKTRNFPASFQFAYHAFSLIAHAILMAFLLFGIVLLWKYFPLYAADIRRNLSQELSNLVLNGLKIIVLFIPFFLRMEVSWALLYWSILLWGYLSARERPFLVLFLIFLVYLPFFLRTSSSYLNGPAMDLLLEVNEGNHENWDRGTEEKLRAWQSSNSEDPKVLFTLGLIEKRMGRYPQAEQFYRRAIERDPEMSEAHSNLGNVYLAQKQVQQAIAAYQRAIELDPKKGSYYYNLYRAYSMETFLSGRSDKAFQKARQLDPDLVQFYSTIEPTNMNRFVVDEVLGPSHLWAKFWEEYVGKEGFLYRLFKAWFEKVPSVLPFLAPILFLAFLIAMTRYTRAKRFLTRCPMCGVATHRFYLGNWESKEQSFVCFNCYRLFVQKEKLHPKMMEKKRLQAMAFQKQNRLAARVLSFVFVGFGDLWRGYPLPALLLLSLHFIFLLKFLQWIGLVPGVGLGSPLSWSGLLWGGLFVIFYLLSYRREARQQPEFEIPES
ncbi:MAG: tetratricopeptide repeat protein [Desulfobacterota bacterium]|nr:tetratricopeptide repeat protein [Thermodesulfobacteriota bacterium]